MGMELLARLKKAVAGTETSVKGSEGGALHTLPYYIQWTAKGYGKQAASTGAIASLQIRPSTTSMLTLYNAEAGGGKSYVIQRCFAHQLVTGNQEVEASIWLCVHRVGRAVPSGNNITVRNSTRGQAAGGSVSVVDTAEGITDDGWFPWGNWTKCDEVGVTPGGHVEANINGRIILPPRGGLSIHVVSGHADNDYNVGFHWFEVPQSELGLGV